MEQELQVGQIWRAKDGKERRVISVGRDLDRSISWWRVDTLADTSPRKGGYSARKFASWIAKQHAECVRFGTENG
jgi:hypothetical protein